MGESIQIEGLGSGFWPIGSIANAAMRGLAADIEPQRVADRVNAYGPITDDPEPAKQDDWIRQDPWLVRRVQDIDLAEAVAHNMAYGTPVDPVVRLTSTDAHDPTDANVHSWPLDV